MALDLTSFDAALKDYYTDDTVEEMTYQKHPLMAMLPKDEKFVGRRKPIPIIYGNPQSRSATFGRAKARALVDGSKVESFDITRVKDYGIAVVDNETLLASEGDKGAFLEAATTELDGVIRTLSNSLATALYRGGWGSRGQVASVSSATLTLLNIDDVVNFEVGMELAVAAAEATGAIRAYGSSTNGLLVTKINRVTGVLTFGANVTDAANGIPGTTANDFLFVRGDRTEGVTPVRQMVSGLEAWLPYSGVSATSFFGVDRTIDATRLGGLTMDGTLMPIEEALIQASALVHREGGDVSHCFMNPMKIADLIKSMGSKVQYVDAQVGNIGFRGVKVMSPDGTFEVYGDPDCPTNRGYALQMDTWKLCSLGKAPRILDTDGMKWLRQNDADGVEVRYGYYAQLGCKAPGFNLVMAL